ncbi:hypothetical protein HY449_01160 [Candidatus Pacearchaeota archaeon]|nr:hypothetical protein [Candidatus Pacearchaeota archaeon]
MNYEVEKELTELGSVKDFSFHQYAGSIVDLMIKVPSFTKSAASNELERLLRKYQIPISSIKRRTFLQPKIGISGEFEGVKYSIDVFKGKTDEVHLYAKKDGLDVGRIPELVRLVNDYIKFAKK